MPYMFVNTSPPYNDLRPSDRSYENTCTYRALSLDARNCCSPFQDVDLVRLTADGFADGAWYARAELLDLPRAEAAVLLELLQHWLDVTATSHPSRTKIISLLVKLASCSDCLPSSLFIEDTYVFVKVCSGGFSDVFQGSYQGRLVAIKEVRSFQNNTSSFARFFREVLVWRQLKHPHVLPLIGVMSLVPLRPSLVSPWMKNGTLKDFMRSSVYQPLCDGVRFLIDVSEGLAYLHSHEVIHGDLTDMNVFVDDQHRAVLADFGLSIVGDSSRDAMTATGTGAGSIRWMSPERFAEICPRRSRANDVYAFGCLCYLMFAGVVPFHDCNRYAIPQKVMDGKRAPRPTESTCRIPLPDEMWSLIEDCWAHEPASRPSISVVRARLEAATS